MVSDTNDYDDTTGDDYIELARLQQRTWAAAMPYLAAAVLSWIGAGFTEYEYRQIFAQGSAVGETTLQVLSQALLYSGLGLFTIGLLVAALRQHERWRRDCGPWLGASPAREYNLTDDDVTDAD